MGELLMHEHGRESLAQARKRACDYHRANLKVAGFDAMADEECTEEMGDLTSIGEQYITHQYQEKSVAPLWIAGALSALVASVLTWAIVSALTGDPEIPDPIDTNTDTQYKFGLSVEPGGALGGSEGEEDDDSGD